MKTTTILAGTALLAVLCGAQAAHGQKKQDQRGGHPPAVLLIDDASSHTPRGVDKVATHSGFEPRRGVVLGPHLPWLSPLSFILYSSAL